MESIQALLLIIGLLEAIEIKLAAICDAVGAKMGKDAGDEQNAEVA